MILYYGFDIPHTKSLSTLLTTNTCLPATQPSHHIEVGRTKQFIQKVIHNHMWTQLFAVWDYYHVREA